MFIRDFGRRCYDPFTTAMVVGGVAAVGTGVQVQQGRQAAKKAGSAAQAAIDRQDQAAAQLVADQASAASQAQASVEARKRRIASGSKSVYTSPLGISGAASLARKTLLGQ